jgi:hypothetical protein
MGSGIGIRSRSGGSRWPNRAGVTAMAAPDDSRHKSAYQQKGDQRSRRHPASTELMASSFFYKRSGAKCDPTSCCGSAGNVTALLRHLLDHLDHLVSAIPVMPSKGHEFTGFCEHRISVGCAVGHGHPSAPSELDQPLVTKGPQCSQHRVVVDTQDRSEISCSGRRSPG